jgi:hypothetical protein
MSVQSQTKRPKKRRNNNLKADVVMRLFLHDTLAIRNLARRIHELDRKLAQQFVAFNRLSESLERSKIAKFLTFCLSTLFGLNASRKPDLNSSVI